MARSAGSLFRTSLLDAWMVVLLGLSFVATLCVALSFEAWSWGALACFGLLLVAFTLMAQNGQHYHTHVPFFSSSRLNRCYELLVSLVYAQPQTGYAYHHFGHHQETIEYDFPVRERVKDIVLRPLLAECDLLRLGFLLLLIRTRFRPPDDELRQPGSFRSMYDYWVYLIKKVLRHAANKRSVYNRLLTESIAIVVYRGLLLYLNPSFFLFVLLPAEYFVNAALIWWEYNQHFATADTTDSTRDAVSCYGRLYNLLFFNDGYHQEHHYRMNVHWSRLPALRHEMPPPSERRVVSHTLFVGMLQHSAGGQSETG